MFHRVRARLAPLCALTLLATVGTSRAAVVTVAADKVIRVDGQPFFPIMQWAQCGWRIADQSALGINTFVGNGCTGDTSADFLDDCQAAGAWGVVDPGDMSVVSHPALLGWVFGDEPDLESHQVEPVDIQSEHDAIVAADPDHVTFLTVTARFYSGFDPPDWMQGSRDRYLGYGAASDVVGFDHYPVYGWCRPDWIDQIGDAHRELIELYAPSAATYQWIECTSESGQWCELCDRCSDPPTDCSRDNPCEGDGTYPEEVRNEVWQAIAHGATAIGYFTHAWECPAYTQFCVDAALEAELLRTNQQITALTGPLLAPAHGGAVTAQGTGSARVDLLARASGGQIYLFAVNTGREAQDVSFEVGGMRAGSQVEVYDEARQIAASGTAFSDSFQPLEVHIYVVEQGGAASDAGVGVDHGAADAAVVVDASTVVDAPAADTAVAVDARGDAEFVASEPEGGGVVVDGCACGAATWRAALPALASTVCMLGFRSRRVKRARRR